LFAGPGEVEGLVFFLHPTDKYREQAEQGVAQVAEVAEAERRRLLPADYFLVLAMEETEALGTRR
jgi:hypothetical protein